MVELSGGSAMAMILDIRAVVTRAQKKHPTPGPMVYPTAPCAGRSVRIRSGFFGETVGTDKVTESGQINDVPVEELQSFTPRNFASYPVKTLSTQGDAGYSICGFMQYKGPMERESHGDCCDKRPSAFIAY